ncbi:hypothetical protein BH11BAC5_BH11BAC5_33960 [soil metagenome]|jgi:hypothetical protein
MSKFSLDSEMMFEVTARFIAKGTDAPVTGNDYILRLFDKDIFDEDFIGESKLDDNGRAKISFRHEAFGDLANLETFPDFYFVVYKQNVPVFQSKLMQDVDLVSIERYRKGEGEVIDLGTYLIDA